MCYNPLSMRAAASLRWSGELAQAVRLHRHDSSSAQGGGASLGLGALAKGLTLPLLVGGALVSVEAAPGQPSCFSRSRRRQDRGYQATLGSGGQGCATI